MDAKEGQQTADIVSHKGKSSQEEYYRYRLLEAKLRNLRDDNADELLTIQSEREAIEMNILRKLINITESSPEFAQVVDITGSRDRYEQARILSEVVYDKVRAETILGFYTPAKQEMTSYFTKMTNKSLSVRSGPLGPDNDDRSVTSLRKNASLSVNGLFGREQRAAAGGDGGNVERPGQ